MHIIIDGYNLIRQSRFRQYELISLERGRTELIRSLVAYQRQRGYAVTVVFDGWLGGSPDEERDCAGEVQIIYSRIGEKADEVIKRLSAKSGEETTIVTSDRAVATHASRRGSSVVSAAAFANILESLSLPPDDGNTPAAGSGVSQYLPGKSEDPENDGRTKKKGPAYRLSRKKKAARAAIKKL